MNRGDQRVPSVFHVENVGLIPSICHKDNMGDIGGNMWENPALKTFNIKLDVFKGAVYNPIKRMDYQKKQSDILQYLFKMKLIFFAKKIESKCINNNLLSLSFLASWLYIYFFKIT